MENTTFFKRVDWTLVLFVLFLNLVGLANLYSATHGPQSSSDQYLFTSQLLWLSVGWSIFFIFTLIDYQIIQRLAYPIYFLNLSFVVYVSFFGKIALGAQRWIDFGFFRYQPSETMKIAIIMVLAKIMHGKSYDEQGLGLKDLFWPVLVMLVPFVLILKQPDLGTAMMIGLIGSLILMFLKIRTRILVAIALLVVVAAPLGWNYVLRDYQRDRILNFISPANDPRGSGYNSIQSRIAVGSGKFLGKGFQKGTQSQLEFLPERHTDFIFSVLSEEHGFVGSMTTLVLFSILFFIILRIAGTAKDKFGALLVVGVLSYIFCHMLINVGMVIGLLPIVGVPLPLLSYGGSSMLTTMAGLGLISSVAYRRYIF